MKIDIFCENIDSTLSVEIGTSLHDICKETLKDGKKYITASVNNQVHALNYKVYTPISVRFIDLNSTEGIHTYQRTAVFILQAALSVVIPDKKLTVKCALGDGFYCELSDTQKVSKEDCKAIKEAFQDIVSLDIPIIANRVLTAAAVELFKGSKEFDKVELLKTRGKLYCSLASIGNFTGYFYEPLAISSSYISLFDIEAYHNGIFLNLPSKKNINTLRALPKLDLMFNIFQEFHRWVDIMGVPVIGQLNKRVLAKQSGDLIKIAEAFHEKRIARIADKIEEANHSRGASIVLISGPSSSGKTTTAKRLSIQLQILGWHPVLISLDDYFVNRADTPLDKNGDYDYEALEAIDLKLLNEHLNALLHGQAVTIPRYNFKTGLREWYDTPLKLDDRSIIIMEGIHGLNPNLTPDVDENRKFKIYASCFTSVSLDNVNRIRTTDNRLLRRITRDYYTRGCDATSTIARWESVRRGEEKHIFPYQENADMMFNTSLFYEISVIRPVVEPILREVPESAPEYREASRLLKFLEYFIPITSDEIPPTSILREFIGGSSFTY